VRTCMGVGAALAADGGCVGRAVRLVIMLNRNGSSFQTRWRVATTSIADEGNNSTQ
jgi:hypothetical protein